MPRARSWLLRQWLLAALALTAAVSAAPADLRGTGWDTLFAGTPFELFDKTDQQYFYAALREALNETPDSQSVRWKNPNSDRHGAMTVVRSFEWRGRACKHLLVTNNAGRRTATNPFYACIVEGKWKLVSEAQLKN